MKVLVIGSGGREHAIIWKLRENKNIDEIYCAPGNAGIAEIAQCVNIQATDIENLVLYAQKVKIDLTIVGMDDPLVAGIVDKFEAKGLRIFGPSKKAAAIEGSKAYSKELMRKYKIPTAAYEIFDDYTKALDYIQGHRGAMVVKADGLALGKGVLICKNKEEATDAIKQIMIDKKFGNSGNKVVIEELLTGPEVSVLAFCDGETIVPMVSAQDHKRALDNDQGLNTGGMGTFSPSRVYTKEVDEYCMEKIFKPTVAALKSEGRPFKGIIFFGLMLTENGGPKVIEYNARFGDPETQVVLPRLKTDLLDIFQACIDGTLHKMDVQWHKNAAACVILASGGYPESYQKGYEIRGLDELKNKENVMVFHAGTARSGRDFVTNGGRVLGVTGIGKNLDSAIKTAYENVKLIEFEKMHYRRDIGIK